jgi:hypothetical protein
MGSSSTIYDVKVAYSLKDTASSGIKTIGAHTDKAAKSALSLKGALAAVGGVALLKGAKSALLDFNSEIDQMKIGLTAIGQMQLKLPFEKARVEADKLFKVFQEMAKKSPATTKDFMEMGSALAPTIALMGGGTDKIAKLSQGGVLASQAFGERSDVIARDIKQMLMGQVTAKDNTALQLLGSRGLDAEKFNAMSGGKRASLVESMLQDPALLKAADQMGESFAGQVSTFKDQLQMAIGTVGLPLMKSLTAEVKRWNTWIEKHPRTIKEWATSFGNGLKSAFETVKSVASWLVEHKDLIFTLGKAVLAFKGAQIAGNVFKQFTTGVGSLAAAVTKGATTIGGIFGVGGGAGSSSLMGAFGGLTRAINPVTGALAMLAAGIGTATYLIHKHAAVERRGRENAIGFKEAVGDIAELQQRRKTVQGQLAGAKDGDLIGRLKAEEQGISSKLYSPETIGLAMRKINEVSEKGGGVSLKALPNDTNGLLSNNLLGMLPTTFDRKNLADNTKVMGEVESTLKTFQNLPSEIRQEALKFAFPEQYGMPTPTETKAPDSDWGDLKGKDINVNIQRIEVASDDPDRFVFQLAKTAEQAVKNRTQARSATPGGF